MELVGTASDPDGDAVEAWWWCYAEAGTYPGGVDVLPTGPDEAPSWSLTVPDDARPGQTVHVVFQVRDDGTPRMTSYQRVVVDVR